MNKTVLVAQKRKLYSTVIIVVLLLSFFGFLFFVVQPSQATVTNNGIWTQMFRVTATNCTELVSHDIKYIYPAYGEWEAAGTINVLPSVDQITAAVTAAHDAGLKIYAWIIDNGGDVDLTTSGARATAAASLVNVITTYGFDGIADDIEIWHPMDNLITFFNLATVELNGVGAEYFTTLIAYWIFNDLSTAQIASIQVNRLQPMLYDLWGDAETNHKLVLDKTLTYATCAVGVALPTFGSEVLADSIQWTDEQLVTTPTTYLVGFDLFDYTTTNAAEWITWDNWSTKDVTPPPAGPESVYNNLNTPYTGGTVTTATQTFTYTPVILGGDTYSNASLFINNSLVASNGSAVLNNTLNGISYTLPGDGFYLWDIQVFNTTMSVFSLNGNFTLTMATPTPTPSPSPTPTPSPSPTPVVTPTLPPATGPPSGGAPPSGTNTVFTNVYIALGITVVMTMVAGIFIIIQSLSNGVGNVRLGAGVLVVGTIELTVGLVLVNAFEGAFSGLTVAILLFGG